MKKPNYSLATKPGQTLPLVRKVWDGTYRVIGKSHFVHIDLKLDGWHTYLYYKKPSTYIGYHTIQKSLENAKTAAKTLIELME